MTTALVPARMSFEDCARSAAAALRRHGRADKTRRRSPATRSIFKGAETSRLTLDWATSLAPADDELRWSLARLRARARELARNNPYVRGYMRMLTDNVIGPKGVKHQAQVRDNDGDLNELFNDRIEESWTDWSRNVTIGTPLSLTAFSCQALRTVATDGEILVRKWRGFDNPHAFALEAIDADQLDEQLNRPPSSRDNEIRMGVELDAFGRPVAYHVWDSPLYTIGMSPERRRERIPASEILHLYHPDRVAQSRGVTWLAAAMYALNMLDGYEEAELVAARVSASKMGFLVKRGDDSSGGFSSVEKIDMEANPGSMETLPPGYELQSWTPDHPAAQFPAFVKAQLRKIARALNVSYNLLANDLEGVNYSSMRSGMLSERDNWRSLQHWWIAEFLVPVYAEWLNMALLAGALRLDQREFARLTEAKWTPRGWAWVDPLKDMQAGIQGIPTGLASRTDLLAEQGFDYEEVLEQLAREQELAREHGVDVSGPKSATTQKGGGEDAEEDDEEVDTDASQAPAGRGVNRIAAALALPASRNGSHR